MPQYIIQKYIERCQKPLEEIDEQQMVGPLHNNTHRSSLILRCTVDLFPPKNEQGQKDQSLSLASLAKIHQHAVGGGWTMWEGNWPKKK